VDSAGSILGDSAFAHFTRLGAELRSDVTIARAFTTVLLPGRNGLCSRPFTGTSTAAGAADVPTRVAGWKLLGLVSAGFEQGGKARRKTPRGCHAEKQPLLGENIQAAITGEHGFPDVAQLTVARIGDVLLGAMPFEPTTTVGRMWRDSMLADSASVRLGVTGAVIVGLANGFAQYVATAPEYAEQFYEGGSTIYGPRTAGTIAGELRLLSESIVRTHPMSPPAWVAPITAYPGAPKEIMPRADSTPRLTGGPKLLEQRCAPDGTLRITWLDEPPGRLTPSGGPILVLQQDVSGDRKALAWDDRPDVVVEALGAGKGGYRWQASMPSPLGGAPLRLRLLPRRGFPGKDFEAIKPCS
jgi:hypothetical protein